MTTHEDALEARAEYEAERTRPFKHPPEARVRISGDDEMWLTIDYPPFLRVSAFNDGHASVSITGTPHEIRAMLASIAVQIDHPQRIGDADVQTG